VQLWEEPDDAMRVMGAAYSRVPIDGFGDVYLRRGSERIRWDRLAR
jgi:hypothetical protein